MAQFDVYRLRSGAGSMLVVDLQNGLFEGLATRLVAPLYPLTANARPMLRLTPVIEIGGQRYLIAIQEMAALRAKSLGEKVTSLDAWRDVIAGAIDFLITSV
jgi:toxin CcdB